MAVERRLGPALPSRPRLCDQGAEFEFNVPVESGVRTMIAFLLLPFDPPDPPPKRLLGAPS